MARKVISRVALGVWKLRIDVCGVAIGRNLNKRGANTEASPTSDSKPAIQSLRYDAPADSNTTGEALILQSAPERAVCEATSYPSVNLPPRRHEQEQGFCLERRHLECSTSDVDDRLEVESSCRYMP